MTGWMVEKPIQDSIVTLSREQEQSKLPQDWTQQKRASLDWKKEEKIYKKNYISQSVLIVAQKPKKSKGLSILANSLFGLSELYGF